MTQRDLAEMADLRAESARKDDDPVSIADPLALEVE